MKAARILASAVLSVFLVLTAGSQIVDRRLAPIIATSEEGVPVRSYGELYVYDQSPDFQPHNTIQFNNANPKEKIQPLKSWEIDSNLFGATPPRMPRAAHTDRQFQLPINLIDGNPETWWVSLGQGMPNVEPEWIRLDLAQDQVINEIVLYPMAEPFSERSALDLAPKDALADLLYKNP